MLIDFQKIVVLEKGNMRLFEESPMASLMRKSLWPDDRNVFIFCSVCFVCRKNVALAC